MSDFECDCPDCDLSLYPCRACGADSFCPRCGRCQAAGCAGAAVINLAAYRVSRAERQTLGGREDAAYLSRIEDIVNGLLAYLKIDVEQAIAADRSPIRESRYERLIFLGSRALDRVAHNVAYSRYPGRGWARRVFGEPPKPRGPTPLSRALVKELSEHDPDLLARMREVYARGEQEEKVALARWNAEREARSP